MNNNNIIALFLSEIIRSRRTSIPRAAEISNQVLHMVTKVQDEDHMLHFLSELEKEFEEVSVLKEALHFGNDNCEIKVYEQEIREYAAELFKNDMIVSANFLQDAARHGVDIQQLCLKYPLFCNYLMTKTDKAPMVKLLQPS